MMKPNLKKFKITSKKPLPVDDFIEKILYEPEIGYYSSKDPFGKNGDFITSPTISNLFSEIIGIWLISAWEKMGKPKVFNFVELGPGDGSLTTVIISTLKKFPEFPKSWKNDELNNNWNKINKIRDIANISIEEKRAAKTIGSSLETAIDIRLTKDLYNLAKKYDFSEICITSLANIILDETAKDEIEVKTSKANGKKCSICWKIRETECERHPTCSFK